MHRTALQSNEVKDVLTAVYAMDGSQSAWLDSVHAALGGLVDLGQGTLLSLLELTSPRPRIYHVQSRDAHPFHRVVLRLTARFAGARLREAFYNGRVLDTSSGHYSDLEFGRLHQAAKPIGARDAAGFCVNDGVDHGLMIIAPSSGAVSWDPEWVAAVRRLGVHVSTAFRLRRAIATCSLDGPGAEALFERDGRCQNASGMAREPGVAELLREAMQRRALRAQAPAGEDAWDAVLGGRWSLVERVDTDGRQYVVAYRNPAGVLDPRRLTVREREITALASLGYMNKEIGHELGISTSTVGVVLASALAKLGLRNRVELPLFWRDLHGAAFRLGDHEGRLMVLTSRAHEGDGRHEADGLTPSEHHVAVQLSRGSSYEDIARARGVSKRTVANQVARVYRKLNVGSRAQLAALLAVSPRAQADTTLSFD